MAETTTHAELCELVARADGGDAQALVELRRWFDANPQVWQTLGDLARHAQEALVNDIATKSVVTAEALRRLLAYKREELGESEASPLERLLIERVTICWAAAYAADLTINRAINLPPGQADFHLKAQARADRRFHAAVRSLATVRRLLKPRPHSPLEVAGRLQANDVAAPLPALGRRAAAAGVRCLN